MSLFAKSGSDGQRLTLVEHTEDVLAAFQAMFGVADSPTRLGTCWQRFFRFADFPAFFNCGVAAALLHDWGKANDGFQEAVSGRGRQLIWHEHLSALLMNTVPAKDWFASRADLDWDVILSAVLTHHLRAKRGMIAELLGDGMHVFVETADSDFDRYLDLVRTRLHLAEALPRVPTAWHFDSRPIAVHQARQGLEDRLHDFHRSLRKTELRRRLLWGVRAALIAADAVGSAMPRVGESIKDWIQKTFDTSGPYQKNDIWKSVIEPRIAQLQASERWDDTNGLGGWNQFQIECDNLPARALLLAPCGAGKTLAAWRWIAQHCGSGVRRVVFLYPTRATATEGFRDYVSWAPEDDAVLLHGSAEYDLQGMFENPVETNDPRGQKDFGVDPRLFALAFWSRRIFAATVDQFFGFLQYGYGPMCLLPMLADSVVVVDEVHSFDAGMFSALKQFLENFNVPVLCMTATLPTARINELREEVGMQVYDDKPGELATIAGASRYHVERVEELNVASRVKEAVSRGQRVLWVVNKVKRAQQLARSLAIDDDLSNDSWHVAPEKRLYCYHSRFKLEDRRRHHQSVVRAFQGNGKPALAITTQVCEMSLDMDADLLVTEVAPITALIQRMGRCNRRSSPRAHAGIVLVYKPEDEKPYDTASLQGTDAFLSALVAKSSVSQVDLETALAEYGPSKPDIPKDCNFLTSGPFAAAGEAEFRDIEDFTIPGVLDCDLEQVRSLCKRKAPFDGFVVPVPRRLGTQGVPGLPDYLATAPSDHYHSILGFCDDRIAFDGGWLV
ncbi:MAG TPA: CRISPR-associated helicase Cas3' [Planctomycetaceae bacterium]|jgi:CRISPR-associated endonuclease/helicase Cas3